MDHTIEIKSLSKLYRLGVIGTGTLSHDLNRWWYKVRGKEDPYMKIGESNVRDGQGESDYVWALKDINLQVPQGEVLGIIGKNGAGKSTLLKILSKVTGPSRGSIKYQGRIGSLLEVGTGFHPELTGRENIFLNGAILGMTKSEIKGKLDEIIDFAGVARYVDTPVKRYSSGMKVRLGFAVAAHLEPEILVVDEVLAVGDAEFQKKAVGKMQDVSKKDGRTILFVSHNMASIQNLCSRVVVMEEGGIVYDGEVSDGIQQYLSSSLKNLKTQLRDREDRKGGKHFRFKDVRVYSGAEGELTSPQTGKDLKIKVSYEAVKQLENVVIRIILVTHDGTVKFVCNNFHSSETFKAIGTRGYFLCTVPNLPLIRGRYFIHLTCMSNRDILDDIEFAHEFDVVEGDFYRTGKLPVINSVLVDHNIIQVSS
ncbi:MAG: ABC transporter ATP-binding protein [bacterium]|jgi:lipopolysaccharide transport system ATP-binding protein